MPAETGRAVPVARLARMARLGGAASCVGGAALWGGLRALAQGQRPDLARSLLTPANATRVTQELAHLRGAALKLGQMLSMDSGIALPQEVTDILARLRDAAQPMAPHQLRIVLDGQWGKGWYGQFKRFDLQPFAAASIGQVHRAVTRDGRDLAIKVQYPGVRDSIDADVDNIALLLRLPWLLPHEMEIAPLLAEAKRQLHQEADYQREARNLRAFKTHLAGSGFALPELEQALCTDQVLAMRFMPSQPLEALRDAPQTQRDHVAAQLITLVLRELFEFGAMQTDPNLANYRYDATAERVVLLDFGAVQRISPALSGAFRDLARAALDGVAVRDAMGKIGYLSDQVSATHQAQITEMFTMATAPLRQNTPFDFGASDLLARLAQKGQALGTARDLTHIPPPETLFLHRKIGGMYLMAAKLRARVALRPLIAPYL